MSPQKAEEGAARLALACVLTRKLTLRYGVESDRIGAAEAALDPADILRDWDEKARRALLERPLFGIANYGRVRFHHRSVIEYLAAEQLKVLLAGDMATRTLKSLLFADTPEGLSVVRPSMRPIAAWLAADQTWVFNEILAREPEVVLDFADPESLSPGLRCAALAAYVLRYHQGSWRGMDVPKIQIHRFACPALASTILQHWQNGVENPEVRQLLIKVVGAGKITACADLVWQVVLDDMAELAERRAALLALAELKDLRIPELLAMLAEAPEKWPQKFLKAAILHFFPDYLPLPQLKTLLAATTESEQVIDEMGRHLPRFIAERPCAPEYLNGLRELLTALVLEKAESIQHGWKFRSGRGHLINALAAVCQRQVLAGVSVPSLFDSIVAAIRLSWDEYPSRREPVAQLKAALNSLPDKLREHLFWADVRLTQQLWPEGGSWQRAYRTWEYGSVRLTSERDAAWAWESLSDRSRALDERWIVLDLLLHLLVDGQPTQDKYVGRLELYVHDSKELAAQLKKWLQPVPEDPEVKRFEKRQQTYRERHLRKEAKDWASWISLWREVSANPQAVFNEARAENTAWDLWQVARQSGHDQIAGWNRRFIEKHFSKEVADRLRQTLMAVWRQQRPTLCSERSEENRNTYLTIWDFGLAGLYAEAEDLTWASQLSHDEAVLAARYVPLALNNFPAWFSNFALAHPRAVDEVLGQELSCELAESVTENSQFQILQLLRRADASLVALFLPHLVCWFETVFPTQEYGEISKAKERLRMVVDLLLEHGDVALSENVQKEAAKQLAGGLDVPFADVWLPTLFRLSPADGAAVFAQGLPGLANEAAITWFAALFSERPLASPIDLSDARFTPELRLQLLRLAYRYVRPEEDIRHEGPYRPDVRDNAQRARSKLLDAVLDLSGPSAWAIKVEMANDPLFTDFRDRALQLAKEKAAQDIDSRIYSSADMQALYKGLDAVPANTDELFELMGNRLDDLEDFLLQDASPRELWAQIDEEKLMRREIARVLGEKAKGAYTVEQENVTADEKETDIRLNIVRSNLVGVIELKLGNKSYSGRDLRDTLRNQLVEKYMAPSNRRAGYLLVTLAKDRNWEHPETGETLDVEGLWKMLATEARRIVEEMGYSLRLGVKVLDLRPRLPGKRDV